MRRLLDVGQSVDLIDSAFFEFRNFLELFRFDDFYGYLLPSNDMKASIDFAINSFSNHVLQRVVLYNLSHSNSQNKSKHLIKPSINEILRTQIRQLIFLHGYRVDKVIETKHELSINLNNLSRWKFLPVGLI